MGAIYHKGQPYSGQMVVDTDLSKVSNNPLKNRAIAEIIDEVVAPIENGSTASQGYSEGEEFIIGDALYKALSAISASDPIVTSGAGQNADTAGSIVSQLKALFDGDARKVKIVSLTDANTNYTDYVLRMYRIPSGNGHNLPDSTNHYWIFEYGTTQYRKQIAISEYLDQIWVRYKTQTGAVWSNPWTRIYSINDGNYYTGTNLEATIANDGGSGQIGKVILPLKGRYIVFVNGWPPITKGYISGPNTSIAIPINSNYPVSACGYYFSQVDNYEFKVNLTNWSTSQYSGTPNLDIKAILIHET